MPVFSLQVQYLNTKSSTPTATILAAEFELSSFGYFQRSSVQEFLNFNGKLTAERTAPGMRQKIEIDAYLGHVYVRNDGLCGVIVTDKGYPTRVAFSALNKILDEFADKFPSSQWPELNPSITSSKFPLKLLLDKCQTPESNDPIMKVQKELDETKIVLHKTMESLLQRGEKLDDLVTKSDQLSAQSKMFYKTAKKTNSCCNMSGLNDQEVANEMNKMVAFIKQEALEKAREIKVKADEEFNIEKAKLVRQETLNIEAFYQKKTKLAEVQRKIAQSNHVNKSRLKVLQARQQMLNELFLEARKRLPIITDNRESYSKLLSGLILQGLYQLMESKVTIQCRKKDLEFVKAACEDSKAAYLKNFPKLSVNFEFDEENPLPENCPGGAVVSVMQGKICCANTLDARLDLLADKMLPDIRILLFGVSENRAFYN